MVIKIRKAKKREFKELSQIYMVEFSKPPYNDKWTPKKAFDKIKFYSKFCDIWTILYNKEIVGVFIVNPNWWCPGEIVFGEELAIKQELQGNGIGKYSFKYIFSFYKKRGFKKFMFISDKKSKAYKIYKKWGYKPSKKEILMETKLK